MTKIPDEAVKELRDAIKAARTTATGFSTFADELATLDESIEAIRAPSKPLPQGAPPTPLPARARILDQLEQLLDGHPFATLEKLDERRKEVDEATDAAEKWLDVRDEISERHHTLSEVRTAGIPAGKDKAFDDAEVAVIGAYSALLTESDIDRAAADWLRPQLDHVRDLVDDFYQPAPVGPDERFAPIPAPAADEIAPAGVDIETNGAAAGPEAFGALKASLLEWIGSLPWFRGRDEYARFTLLGKIQRTLLLVLAVVVAVVSGLHALYVGKPFGTTWDYINLFIWGFTTKIVFDLVVGSLDSLGLLRLARR
jgi:hypothetical protein